MIDFGEKVKGFQEDIFPNWEKYFQQYKGLQTRAREVMARKKVTGRGQLIAVCAQHPLENGLAPGPEFRARLDKAYELYQKYAPESPRIGIYVPGSRHQVNGVADEVSLAKAGCDYLLEKGVPVEHLYGEETIKKYKGDAGCYNAPDEIFTATCLFEDGNFAELHQVCSLGQVTRNLLTFYLMEYEPIFHPIVFEKPHHDILWETFWSVPIFLEDGNALQGDSKLAREMRADRNPDYKG